MREILDIECSEEQFQWFQLFINDNPGRLIEFERILNSRGNVQYAINQLRKVIVNENIGIGLDDLEKAYISNENEFKDLLQEMFAEYINEDYIFTIMKLINKNKWTMEKLYKEHLENPVYCVNRIISLRCE